MTLSRRVTVLGATGSVGTTTLSLIEASNAAGEADIEVVALTANSNAKELAELAIAHRAEFAAVCDEAAGPALADALAGTGIRHGAGVEAVIEAAMMDAGWVMAAIVGAAGIQPLLAAATRGADIAFANKECLVCAGDAVLAAMGAVVLTAILLIVLIGPLLPIQDPDVTATADRFKRPFTPGHLLGTDHLGRDLLSGLFVSPE